MQIIIKKVNDIIPYDKNPRKNDKSVRYVANSIKEFGFKVPIVIDKDGVIVTGHTRLKAAKLLNMKEVPVIIADDLTEEQVKAFRLADNKVGEGSEWDDALLAQELGDLLDLDFDMEPFGFDTIDLGAIDLNDEQENERLRTDNAYNLPSFDPARVDGWFQMPVLQPCKYVPDDLIGFNYMLTSEEYEKGIHFFIDDYQFERVWNDPQTYIEKLRNFRCVLTPDFSLYMDMPMAMKIWNVYRSRLIGQMCQDAGMDVIPTLSWAEPETFAFCFDGILPGGTVAVSTVGVMRDPDAQEIWKAGMDEAIRRIRPKTVLCYGAKIDYDFRDVAVKQIEPRKGWQ